MVLTNVYRLIVLLKAAKFDLHPFRVILFLMMVVSLVHSEVKGQTTDTVKIYSLSLGFAFSDQVNRNVTPKERWGGEHVEFHFGRGQVHSGLVFHTLSELDGSVLSYQRIQRDSTDEQLTVSMDRRITQFSYGAIYYPIKRRSIIQPYFGAYLGLLRTRVQFEFPDINYRLAPTTRSNRSGEVQGQMSVVTNLSTGIQLNLSKMTSKGSGKTDVLIQLGLNYMYAPWSMGIVLNDGSVPVNLKNSNPVTLALFDKRTAEVVYHDVAYRYEKSLQYLTFNVCFTFRFQARY